MKALTCVLFISVVPTSVIADILIRFVEPDTVHGSEIVRLGGHYVGSIGDHVVLPQGRHEISYDSLHGQRLFFTLTVSSEGVAATNFRACAIGGQSGHRLRSWGVNVDRTTRVDGSPLFSIELGAPVYEEGASVRCPIGPITVVVPLGTGHYFVNPAFKYVTLEVSSTPDGATVYRVDGRRKEFLGLTEFERTIRYHRRRATLRLVFERDGYANCVRDVQVLPDEEERKIACTLVSL